MSEIVSFEVLRERFPSEVLNVFGEVLVIPSRLFQRGWESVLEREGHRVFVSDYKGEATFLVRVEKAEPRNVAHNAVTKLPSPSKVKIDTYKRWEPADIQRLEEMARQGLSVNKMAESLGRTEYAIVRKIQRLRRKGADLPLPELGAVSRPPEPSPVTAKVDESHLIKELLAVASEIYPKYPNATRFLLLETSKMIQAK